MPGTEKYIVKIIIPFRDTTLVVSQEIEGSAYREASDKDLAEAFYDYLAGMGVKVELWAERGLTQLGAAN